MGRVRVRDVASLRLVNPAARATPGPVLTDVRTPATATASWPPALSFSLLSSDRPDLLRAMAAGQLPSAVCLLVALFIPAGLSRKSMGVRLDERFCLGLGSTTGDPLFAECYPSSTRNQTLCRALHEKHSEK